MPGFQTNFERAVEVAQSKTRSELEKMDATIAGLFSIQSQSAGSQHERYIGPVEFIDSSALDVNSDTPNLQHPGIRTRKNKLLKSELAVAVPRGVAQIMGDGVAALAAKYMAKAKAAYMRKFEEQISQLMIETYQDNAIMDGRDATEGGGDFDSVAFPTSSNRVPIRSGTAGQWNFLDLMEARLIIANALQVPVTMQTGMAVDQTIANAKYVVWCDNDTWFSFIRRNAAQYFSGDFNFSKTGFVGDGLKIQMVQDMAIVTTSQELPTTGRPTHFTVATGEAASSSGTGRSAIESDWRPVMIFPVGAFSLAKPTADMFDIQLKEYPTKKFMSILYGECNVYGHRVYEAPFLRYWVDL